MSCDGFAFLKGFFIIRTKINILLLKINVAHSINIGIISFLWWEVKITFLRGGNEKKQTSCNALQGRKWILKWGFCFVFGEELLLQSCGLSMLIEMFWHCYWSKYFFGQNTSPLISTFAEVWYSSASFMLSWAC